MIDLEQLLTLIKDYYAAAKIGAAMEDQTFDEEQDYSERMRELMERTEKVVNVEPEGD